MNLRQDDGFTLIETIIGMVIMLVMVMAISQLFVSNLASMSLARARATGLTLANQQIEDIRRLPYNDAATQSGTIYPPGNIPESRDVTFDEQDYTVKTNISYIDDPFDGNAAGTIAGKPTDTAPADYKRVTVYVNLKSSGKQVAELATNISAIGAETNSGSGVLSISVINSGGQPLSGADVQITNTTVNPAVNIVTTTDSAGAVMVPNLPPDSTNDYHVVVSMSGYSTDQTNPEPAGTQTAVNVNPNILAQQVTPVTLAIDRLSNMTLVVKDAAGVAQANKAIIVTGGKKIATGPDVFKYNQTLTTDAAGQIALTNIEWDSYGFTPPTGSYLLTSSPYAPYALSAGASQTVNLVLGTNSLTPRITKVVPATQSANTTASITVTGVNLIAGSTIKLHKAGSTDISATSVVSSSGDTKLTANLTLPAGSVGAWDIVITNTRGTVTQPGGYIVTP